MKKIKWRRTVGISCSLSLCAEAADPSADEPPARAVPLAPDAVPEDWPAENVDPPPIAVTIT